MKKSILVLSVALISFSAICKTGRAVVLPFQNAAVSIDTAFHNNETAHFAKPSLAEEKEVFNPETVISSILNTEKEIIAEGDKITEAIEADDMELMNYEKSMQLIIAQSELIIDSNLAEEAFPLIIEITLEDEIAAKELIIESRLTNEIFPLDLKNSNADTRVKKLASKQLFGMN